MPKIKGGALFPAFRGGGALFPKIRYPGGALLLKIRYPGVALFPATQYSCYGWELLALSLRDADRKVPS